MGRISSVSSTLIFITNIISACYFSQIKEIINSCCLLGSYDLVILSVLCIYVHRMYCIIRPLCNILKLIKHSWLVLFMYKIFVTSGYVSILQRKCENERHITVEWQVIT